MTAQTIVHLVWIPMAVAGMAVFGAGMFFFARLLVNVRIPFAGRKPLARYGRVKKTVAAAAGAGGLALLVLAFAPGTAPVHSVIGHALARIPAAIGHPLAPGRPTRTASAPVLPAAPPPVFPAQPGTALETARPASPGASTAPVVAAPAPSPVTPVPVTPATAAPAPSPTDTAPAPAPTDPAPSPTDTPAPTPTDTVPAPSDTPTPPPPAP